VGEFASGGVTSGFVRIGRTHHIFNGSGKAAFDSFKLRADEITNELNSSLRAILGGVQGMDASFIQGDVDMADNSRSLEGAANFDGARFTRGA
jgi:filamentous hemagglutinin family protein